MLLGDPEAYRPCLDFVSVLMLAQDAFDSEKEGLATKAEYRTVTAARIATSFDLGNLPYQHHGQVGYHRSA